MTISQGPVPIVPRIRQAHTLSLLLYENPSSGASTYLYPTIGIPKISSLSVYGTSAMLIVLSIVFCLLRYVSRGSLPFDTTKVIQVFHATKFSVKIILYII